MLAAALMMALPAVSGAAEAPELKRWWLELGVGQGEVEVVGHDRTAQVSQALAQAGLDAQVLDAGEPDDTDTRTLGLGYRVNPYLGVVLAYHDLGSTEGNFVARDRSDPAGLIGGSLQSDYRALSLAAMGSWSPLRWLALQGRLGLHHWQHEFRVRSQHPVLMPPVDERIDSSGNHILYGAGLGFTPLSWLGLDLYWERFAGIEDEAGIDVKSIRVVIKFP